jgi:hypothetical protein
MGFALYSSVSALKREWRVLLIDAQGCCSDLLPCSCDSEEEALAYARTYLGLYVN